MALPDAVRLYEVGPREGFQFEQMLHPTGRKLQLIRSLVAAGLRSIEVTSFVSPNRVPQMADAEALASGLPEGTDCTFTSIYLNLRGLQRALAHPRLDRVGALIMSASEAFSLRNMNSSVGEALAGVADWISAYQAAGVPTDELVLMAAFGCNYEGDVPLSRILDLIRAVGERLDSRGERLGRLKLCDTMGWANPDQVERMVAAVRDAWPDMRICLHLHDTRGTGMINLYAGLKSDVTEFETAVGGLGGCPFAGHRSAAGNVPTEDVAFLCAELGISTGLDLRALIEAARLAEEIVGHPLPGKLAKAGLLNRK